MSLKSILSKSIVKALKQTAITVGTAASLASGITLQNPEVMIPIWSSIGLGGPIAILIASVAGQAIVDAVKHSKDKDKDKDTETK